MTQVASGSGAVRFAARGHHRLAYEAINGDVPDGGPVVVLLHALLGERGDFRAVLEALQGASRIRMLLPDARGHGASAALANLAYTLDDMVAEMAAILEAEAVDEVHLVGHELGGASAFAFAGVYPDRVRSLTLIEPALGFLMDRADDPAVRSMRVESRDGDRATAEAAYKGMTDHALDQYLNPRWGMGWREALPKPRLAALRRNAGALGGTLTALGEASLPAKRLAAVDAAIRVVYRKNAPFLSEQIGQHLETELPGTQVVTIPGSDSPLSGAAGAAVGALLRSICAEGGGAR